jgi:hypothetical protein
MGRACGTGVMVMLRARVYRPGLQDESCLWHLYDGDVASSGQSFRVVGWVVLVALEEW